MIGEPPGSPADLAAESERLCAEAEALLRQSGLGDLLDDRFGALHVVGSYSLGTMTWRDLDLYVPCAADDRSRFAATLASIVARATPANYFVSKAVFNDEHVRPRGDYGQGLYLGLRLLTPAATEWKIDLWGWEADMLARKLEEHGRLATALAAVDREALLDLKWRLQRAAGFRDRYTSFDAYQFVIAGGRSFDEFIALCDDRRAGR